MHAAPHAQARLCRQRHLGAGRRLGCPTRRRAQTAGAATVDRRGGRGRVGCCGRALRVEPDRAPCVSHTACAAFIAGKRIDRQPRARAPCRWLVNRVPRIGDDGGTTAVGHGLGCAWCGHGSGGYSGSARSASGGGRAGPATCARYRPHRSRSLDAILSRSSLIGQRQVVVLVTTASDRGPRSLAALSPRSGAEATIP